MEDIGDYFYLIIIAIAGISSFLKNKNKKKEATLKPETENEEEEADSEYEEIPEEVFAPIPTTTVIPMPTQRPEVVFERNFTEMKKTPHDTIMSFDNTSDLSKLKAKKEVAKNHSSMMHSPEDVAVDDQNDYSLSSVDEARAAFIASEIFNRKYL